MRRSGILSAKSDLNSLKNKLRAAEDNTPPHLFFSPMLLLYLVCANGTKNKGLNTFVTCNLFKHH